MTEADVRAVFFKNYSEKDLNDALMASSEEIMGILIADCAGHSKPLPEIIESLKIGRSRADLFSGLIASGQVRPTVPMNFVLRFDELRKAMVDSARYARDNYGTMDPWFKERFEPEHLEVVLTEMALAIEKSSKLPDNVRAFNSDEIRLYGEFFSSVLIGIIGQDNFLKYAEKYNQCAKTLRRCQSECVAMRNMPKTKES